MRSSLVIISSYVRMLRKSLAENASHGMGERANAERASSEERASKRNPATTEPGLGVDLLRMNGSGLAASTVRIVDRIVMPPLQRRRDVGRHAVSLEVTEEKGSRVQGVWILSRTLGLQQIPTRTLEPSNLPQNAHPARGSSGA